MVHLIPGCMCMSMSIPRTESLVFCRTQAYTSSQASVADTLNCLAPSDLYASTQGYQNDCLYMVDMTRFTQPPEAEPGRQHRYTRSTPPTQPALSRPTAPCQLAAESRPVCRLSPTLVRELSSLSNALLICRFQAPCIA